MQVDNLLERPPHAPADEDRLVADMIELTRQYGRYGCRRVAALPRDAGWQVNDKRVEPSADRRTRAFAERRLWRREGLKVPMKQPKKGRLWLNPSRGSRREPLPGSGRILCPASPRASRSCLVV